MRCKDTFRLPLDMLFDMLCTLVVCVAILKRGCSIAHCILCTMCLRYNKPATGHGGPGGAASTQGWDNEEQSPASAAGRLVHWQDSHDWRKEDQDRDLEGFPG